MLTISWDNAVLFKSVNCIATLPPSYCDLSLVILTLVGSLADVGFKNITPIAAARTTITATNIMIIFLFSIRFTSKRNSTNAEAITSYRHYDLTHTVTLTLSTFKY